jgi:hypothetical protein
MLLRPYHRAIIVFQHFKILTLKKVVKEKEEIPKSNRNFFIHMQISALFSDVIVRVRK